MVAISGVTLIQIIDAIASTLVETTAAGTVSVLVSPNVIWLPPALGGAVAPPSAEFEMRAWIAMRRGG